jgi:hypothetical protein
LGRRYDFAHFTPCPDGVHFVALGNSNWLPQNRRSDPLAERDSCDVWLALSGAATVLFGVMLFSRRTIGEVTGLAVLIAIPAVIWGVFEILLGWELRGVRHG